MRWMNRIVVAVGVCGLIAAASVAGVSALEGHGSAGIASVQKLDPAAPATIPSLAFLAGTWTGDMNGGYVEESWSRPRGNNIIGYFRWLRPDGKPIMFEILTITEEGDAVRLRLRHYSAVLVGKEEQDKPMQLKLASVEGSRAVFTAEKDAGDLRQVVYSVSDGVLTIDLDLGEDREPLMFRLQRER